MTDDRTPFREARDAGLAKRHETRLMNAGVEVVHEWRVTGEPGQGYPSYSFTWRSNDARWPTPERAEASARAFVAQFPKLWDETPGLKPWDDGPHLHHRTVTYTAWETL